MWTNDAGYITNANIQPQIWQQNASGISYNSGFVGVGTDKPAKQLHIVTENASSTVRLTNITTNKGTNPPTPIASSFWDIIHDNGNLVFSKGANPAVTISSDGTINAQKFTINGSDILAGSWQTNDNNIYYEEGYVGIGTDVPNVPLHIYGTNPDITLDVEPNKGLNAQINFATDGVNMANLNYNRSEQTLVLVNDGNKLVLDNAGYVGIGTNNPTAK